MWNLVVVLAILAGSVSAAAQDSWQARGPLNRARSNHASAVVGGQVYLFAGTLNGTYGWAHSMDRFDPVTGSYATMAAITAYPDSSIETSAIGWNDPAGVAYGGEIYQLCGTITVDFGGSYPLSLADNCCWKYSPASNAWTFLDYAPALYTECRGAVLGSKIHIMGSYSGFTHSAYDPATQGWSARTAPSPAPASGFGLAAAGGKLILAGGMGSAVTRSYDPATDAWSPKASMPQGLGLVACAGAKGRVYMMGGFGTVSSGTPVYEYNPTLDEWQTRASLPGGRAMMSAVSAVGSDGQLKIYCTGGNDTTSWARATSNYEYSPPVFPRPEDPTGLFMRAPGGSPLAEGGWVGGSSIELGATLDDLLGNPVQLEVEVVPAALAFTGAVTAVSPMGPVGLFHLAVTGLAEGEYKWRCRSRNSNEEINPAGWIEFGTPAADFNLDQTAPGTPTNGIPNDRDVMVPRRFGSPVQFAWVPGAENSPLPVTYDIEVARDFDFMSIVATGGITGATTCLIALDASANHYYWRIRSIDSAGLTNGMWSARWKFRVSFDDGINHGEGDATKICGFGAAPDFSGLALAAMILLAMIRRR